MTLIDVAHLAAVALLCAAPGAHAIDDRRSALGNVGAGIENCVSSDWIRFGREDQSATLDDADHRAVRAEMLRRYPVIGSDGFPSSRTILWQRAAGDLVYIAVIENPDKPSQNCFTATFSAEKFETTLLLRRKYLVPAGAAPKE